jgi:hypothetical protein
LMRRGAMGGCAISGLPDLRLIPLPGTGKPADRADARRAAARGLEQALEDGARLTPREAFNLALGKTDEVARG